MKCFPHHQQIHPGSQEAIKRLLRLADHRLVLVERGVEHHRHAGEVAKGFDQLMIPRIAVPIDGLKTTRTVDMGDGRNERPLLLRGFETPAS